MAGASCDSPTPVKWFPDSWRTSSFGVLLLLLLLAWLAAAESFTVLLLGLTQSPLPSGMVDPSRNVLPGSPVMLLDPTASRLLGAPAGV